MAKKGSTGESFLFYLFGKKDKKKEVVQEEKKEQEQIPSFEVPKEEIKPQGSPRFVEPIIEPVQKEPKPVGAPVPEVEKEKEVPPTLVTPSEHTKQQEQGLPKEPTVVEPQSEKLKPSEIIIIPTSKTTITSVDIEVPLEDQPEETAEWLILHELQKRIEELEQQLQKDMEKIQFLEDKNQQNTLLTEVEDDKKELDDLLDKIKKIKQELEELVGSEDLTLLYSLQDTYLNGIISRYIEQKGENVQWKEEETFLLLQDYISLVDRIIILEKKEENVAKEVGMQEETFTHRDEQFDFIEDETENLQKVSKKIHDGIERQLADITKIHHQVRVSGRIITKRVENTIHRNHFLENLILMRWLASMRATPRNIMIGAVLTHRLAQNFRDTFHPQTEVVIKQEGIYTDLESEIVEQSNDLLLVKGSLKTAMQDVSEMRSLFEKELGDYILDHKEYQKVLDDLDELAKKLTNNEKLVDSMEKETEMVYHTNKEKVKYYEEL